MFNFYLLLAYNFILIFSFESMSSKFQGKYYYFIDKNIIKTYLATFLRVVCSSLHITFLAFSTSLAADPRRYTVREGALGFLEILIISFSLGTPEVKQH